MGDIKKDTQKVEDLKNGEMSYINVFQEGGASVYRCNDMYLLFSIPLYGGAECYEGTYYENQINDLVNEAYSWT